MNAKRNVVLALLIISVAGIFVGALLKLNNGVNASAFLSVGIVSSALALIFTLIFYGNRLFK